MPFGFALKYLPREQLHTWPGFRGRATLGAAAALPERPRPRHGQGKAAAWARCLAGGCGLRRLLRRCFRGAVRA